MSIASPAVAPPAAPVAPPAVPELPICRLSVEQYHRMASAGILVDGDPIELLEGWLVPKMNKNPPHVTATRLTRAEFNKVLPEGWLLDSQDPVTTDDSEPEPDFSVVRGKPRDYTGQHPGPADTGLVVEVADTSLKRDRGIKKRVYARAKIPVYWIINLVDNCVEVYTDPTGPGAKPDYRQRKDYGPDDEVPVVLDGKEVGHIKVRDLLP